MRASVMVAFLAGSVGCEQNTELSVSVTIPLDVMLGIPEVSYPQQVGFATSLHTGSSATVCAPTSEDLVVVLDDVAGVCVQEPLVVEVLMGPFVPPGTGCVEGRADPFTAISQGEITARGSATAFADASEVTCISRTEAVDVEVELSGN